ncbi:MAG: RNA ligase family protein [Hyphomonadaceae bacterium]
MYGHRKFPKIGGLHNVIKTVDHWAELSAEAQVTLDYRAKIKLHGANMGVRIYADGTVIAQSRNEDVDTGGYQFPNFITEHKNYFQNLIGGLEELVIYGEWAGPGVQRKVSVSKIPEKAFFVFTCSVIEQGDETLVTDPAEIEALLRIGGGSLPERVHIVPWHGEFVQIAFADKVTLEKQAADFNEVVGRIDACDPLVQSLYGIEGPGEGLVFYPLSQTDREEFARYAFKVKGKAHAITKGGDAKARTSVPIAENVYAFVDMMVTPSRISQGMQELFGNGPFEKKEFSALLKWVSIDVRTEGSDELEAAELDWAQVSKLLSVRVREYYFSLLENYSDS